MKKIKLAFSRLLNNPLSKHLTVKRITCMHGCFRLFNKNKKGSGTSFWCILSARFFHKNVPYLIFYQLTTFQCQTFFPSQDIKKNVLLNYLDNR